MQEVLAGPGPTPDEGHLAHRVDSNTLMLGSEVEDLTAGSRYDMLGLGSPLLVDQMFPDVVHFRPAQP